MALCEQVEDPKLAKGLVRREVVRLYTPGTLIDSEFLPSSESNVLAAVAHPPPRPGSGDVRSCPSDWLHLMSLPGNIGSVNIMAPSTDRSFGRTHTDSNRRNCYIPRASYRRSGAGSPNLTGLRCCAQAAFWFDLDQGRTRLQEQFHVHSLEAFGCHRLSVAIQAGAAVLRYIRETQPSAPLDHIRQIRVRHARDAMHLDAVTIRNLELVKPAGRMDESAGSSPHTLLGVLDRTVTAMGSRLLREWLLRPLVTCAAIEARLTAVDELKTQLDARVHFGRPCEPCRISRASAAAFRLAWPIHGTCWR